MKLSRNKFIHYKVKFGDTIHMVAQNVLGDANRAMEIAYLNNMDYPFIVNAVSGDLANVRYVGDIILIPYDLQDEDSVEDISDNDIFGTDLLLLSSDELSYGYSGDLVADSYGDLETTRGIQTLKQDLIHRLVTERGTLPHHPDYGSDFLLLIGSKRTPEQEQKCLLELERTFRSDLRVMDVVNSRLVASGDVITISCDIVTSSETFNIGYSFNVGSENE